MRSTSFHFAIRSERENEPTLNWPASQPTARWAMVTSSLSPERAETMVPKPAALPASSGGSRLGDRAGLVRLDEHGGAGACRRRRRDPRGVGDEKIVADHLAAAAGRRGEGLKPASSSSASGSSIDTIG